VTWKSGRHIGENFFGGEATSSFLHRIFSIKDAHCVTASSFLPYLDFFVKVIDSISMKNILSPLQRTLVRSERPPVVEIICSKSVNLFFRVSASGHQGTLGATVISAGLSEWQALGIELCLSFILTLVYLTTMDDHRRTLPASIGPGPLTYGLAYAACSSMAVS
jgi:hypothetical protein